MYIAHINETTKEREPNREHLRKTADLCWEYAVAELKDIMRAIGVLHDIGKYQPSFQLRINGDSSIHIEHSICGAIAAKQKYKGPLGLFMAFCIAGHHSGLPDGGTKNDEARDSTLCGRLKRTTENYSVYEEELKDMLSAEIDETAFAEFLSRDCENEEQLRDKFAFLTRFAFSCLTDADSIATAEFCQGPVNRHLSTDFAKCLRAVNERLASFKTETDLQKARSVLQEQVFSKAEEDSEIYLMNMPTGSGKTLCSVKFALERAIKRGKKRIIYVIPYNSIIEQTARTFDELFGENAEILRHQSTFSYDDEDYDEDYRKTAGFATENWDADFIITTSVQFFESIYASKRGKLRKLHNMADSILIFDEAHLMPTELLQPCLQAISYITRYLNSEAVFLTATMPDYEKLIRDYALKNSRITDLVTDRTQFSSFDKCEYEYRDSVSDEELLSAANENPSGLIIVNSRAAARRLYEKCGGKKYHLSTYMTPLDRGRVIGEIQEALKALAEKYPQDEGVPEEERITVISTSLIEAGVDLDFYAVFREINGLDNVLQAGGRCNREGKRTKGKVIVFGFEEGKYKAKNERQNVTRGLFGKYENVACRESIEEYYEKLFSAKQDDITGKSIHNYCKSLVSIPFRSYAESFEMIESKTESVVVGVNDEGKRLIEQLRFSGTGDSRKLQKYTCSVYMNELDDLKKQHVVDDYGSGIWCLTNPDYYDSEIGILFEGTDYFI